MTGVRSRTVPDNVSGFLTVPNRFLTMVQGSWRFFKTSAIHRLGGKPSFVRTARARTVPDFWKRQMSRTLRSVRIAKIHRVGPHEIPDNVSGFLTGSWCVLDYGRWGRERFLTMYQGSWRFPTGSWQCIRVPSLFLTMSGGVPNGSEQCMRVPDRFLLCSCCVSQGKVIAI